MFKDIFPRYRTMCGYFVERKGGWDCHGLPVELALEAELGFTSKDDIERFGIAEFNARCREKVLSHVEDWNAMTERIGFWIDLDDAYRTLDPKYVESVWWALKTIHDKGLLYEKLKVVPYCPRDQVTLSSHELGQPDVYRDVVDPSIYVRFPVRDPQTRCSTATSCWSGRPRRGRSCQTPRWRSIRSSPTSARSGRRRATCTCWPRRGSRRVLGEGATILDALPGKEIEGAAYEPPFAFIPGSAYGTAGHTVLAADFVTATTAPASCTRRSHSARTTSASASSTA